MIFSYFKIEIFDFDFEIRVCSKIFESSEFVQKLFESSEYVQKLFESSEYVQKLFESSEYVQNYLNHQSIIMFKFF